MKKLNNTQKALKRMIRDTESKITDEELFLSSAFQKYQTSLAKAATGRSRYGLQVLMEWDSSENADIAYTDNYRIHCNAANSITQSFPSRFLRSQSLTGLTGHEIGHLRYSDFASLQLYLTNMENGSFYPEAPDNLPSGYKANLQDILDAMEEKDNATCLTLSRCAAQFNNILEDIYIEARMCEEYPGTFKQGIQINNLRMSELIPSIQEQIDCGYQPFSIMSNLILSYCRTGNINNRTNYSGEYTDTLSDCMDYIDDALIATQGKERLRASNYLLVLCWNYIQPMVELTRESLKKQDSTQVGDALEDLLRKESGSGSPLPTGKNGGIPKNIPGPTVKSKTPITCDLSGFDPNYRQDAINQAEKVLQEEGGRIELAKTTAVLDGNNPGITYASQYAGSGYENAANDLARILNDVATEKAQNDYEQELTEDLQKSADEIHYGTLNIDQQGRIIIPAKVRKALQLHTGDVLMLEADTRNICLRKCDSHIPMDIRLDSFLDILHSNVPCRILLCNDSKIIASKNYHTALNMPVTESIQRLLQQGKMKLFSEKERIYPTMTGKYPISVFFPISKKDEFGETLGLLLCAKNQQPFSEMDLGCAKMTAAAISRYIQQNYERKVT